jgi:hypothetical protein
MGKGKKGREEKREGEKVKSRTRLRWGVKWLPNLL